MSLLFESIKRENKRERLMVNLIKPEVGAWLLVSIDEHRTGASIALDAKTCRELAAILERAADLMEART